MHRCSALFYNSFFSISWFQILLLIFWIVGLTIFILLQFGLVYLTISGLLAIFYNTRTRLQLIGIFCPIQFLCHLLSLRLSVHPSVGPYVRRFFPFSGSRNATRFVQNQKLWIRICKGSLSRLSRHLPASVLIVSFLCICLMPNETPGWLTLGPCLYRFREYQVYIKMFQKHYKFKNDEKYSSTQM